MSSRHYRRVRERQVRSFETAWTEWEWAEQHGYWYRTGTTGEIEYRFKESQPNEPSETETFIDNTPPTTFADSQGIFEDTNITEDRNYDESHSSDRGRSKCRARESSGFPPPRDPTISPTRPRSPSPDAPPFPTKSTSRPEYSSRSSFEERYSGSYQEYSSQSTMSKTQGSDLNIASEGIEYSSACLDDAGENRAYFEITIRKDRVKVPDVIASEGSQEESFVSKKFVADYLKDLPKKSSKTEYTDSRGILQRCEGRVTVNVILEGKSEELKLYIVPNRHTLATPVILGREILKTFGCLGMTNSEPIGQNNSAYPIQMPSAMPLRPSYSASIGSGPINMSTSTSSYTVPLVSPPSSHYSPRSGDTTQMFGGSSYQNGVTDSGYQSNYSYEKNNDSRVGDKFDLAVERSSRGHYSSPDSEI